MANEILTPEKLKQILKYSPETGDFTWGEYSKPSHRGGGPGSPAGTINKAGYVVIMIDGKNYKAHRLAWALFYGEWPQGVIDHVNRITHDNRIENLRDVTQVENGRNRIEPKHNKSGRRGVSFIRARGKWYASITVNYKTINLGCFDDYEDAVKAREIGERRYFEGGR